MIGLDGVTVAFGGRIIIADLSFAVERGRTLAILGPNGRGKTTALRVLIGEQKPQKGRRIAPPFVGYVPQSVNHAYAYSVLDIVEMGAAHGLGLFAQPGRDERARAEEALGRVGLAAFADNRFDRLSGGQRQLALLARALATGSSTIVFDEPTAALDIRNERLVLELMARLRNSRAHELVFTTHDPNHALCVADDALLMMPEGDIVHGPSESTITEANMLRLFGAPMRMIAMEARADVPASRHLIPEPITINPENRC